MNIRTVRQLRITSVSYFFIEWWLGSENVIEINTRYSMHKVMKINKWHNI